MPHDVVSDGILDDGVVSPVDGDCAVVALVDGTAADVLRGQRRGDSNQSTSWLWCPDHT